MRSTAQIASTSKAPHGNMVPWGEVQIDDSSDGPDDGEVYHGADESGSTDDDDYSTVYPLSLNDLWHVSDEVARFAPADSERRQFRRIRE